LPAAASGLSAAIADRVRLNWLTEIDTPAGADEPELLRPAEVLAEELAHAATARLTASNTAAASPFLTRGWALTVNSGLTSLRFQWDFINRPFDIPE